MKVLLSLLTMFGTEQAIAQVGLLNGSFEEMSSCPDDLWQLDRALHWRSIINSSDYYNCGFTSPAYPTISGAYEGSGYVGFATYGNDDGDAEALGQNLVDPLLAGHYMLSFAAKRGSVGTWAGNCGGVEIYGLPDTLPPPCGGIHAAALPGAVLLGTSALVDNAEWEARSIALAVPGTVRSLIFTVQQTPNCFEVIFLDDVKDGSAFVGVGNEITQHIEPFPNPAVDRLNVRTMTPARWRLLDLAGRVRAEGILRFGDNAMDLAGLETGQYVLYRIDTDERMSVDRITKIAAP